MHKIVKLSPPPKHHPLSKPFGGGVDLHFFEDKNTAAINHYRATVQVFIYQKNAAVKILLISIAAVIIMGVGSCYFFYDRYQVNAETEQYNKANKAYIDWYINYYKYMRDANPVTNKAYLKTNPPPPQ